MKEFKGKHDHFGVPIFRVSRVQEIVPDATPAIYELPVGEGLVLTVMARMVAKPNQSLTVVSHGAKEPSVGLPYFNRFASLVRTDRSFLLLSDPTLALDQTMTLAWYLGTDKLDPLDSIANLVDHVAKQWNIGRVLFEGSSGGGFSSLRLAARFPHSIALVFSPQTNVFNYEAGGVADRVKGQLFGGGNRSEVLERFRDRFSVVDLYARLSTDSRRPFVYYVQNSGDYDHVRLQMNPFLEAIADGSAKNHGRLPTNVHVAMVNQGPGHIRPTLEVWEQHEAVALRILDELGGPEQAQQDAIGASESFVMEGIDGVEREVRACNLTGLAKFTSESGHVVSAYLRGESFAPTLLRVFLHPACASSELNQMVVNGAPEPGERTLDIHILDEMVLTHSELRVAWFVGQRDREFLSSIAKLITHIQKVTFSARTLIVGASSGGFAALRLRTKLVDAHVLAFAPDVSIRVYSQGHRDRFLAAGGYTDCDWDDISVASRLDLTLALSTSPLLKGPKPRVFLNRAAAGYEAEQSSYLITQTFQNSTEKAWAALGVEAEYIEYASDIQRPAPHIYGRTLDEASERARTS